MSFRLVTRVCVGLCAAGWFAGCGLTLEDIIKQDGGNDVATSADGIATRDAGGSDVASVDASGGPDAVGVDVPSRCTTATGCQNGLVCCEASGECVDPTCASCCGANGGDGSAGDGISIGPDVIRVDAIAIDSITTLCASGCPSNEVCCGWTNQCVPANCTTCCDSIADSGGPIEAGHADAVVNDLGIADVGLPLDGVTSGCGTAMTCAAGEFCCQLTGLCVPSTCSACCAAPPLDAGSDGPDVGVNPNDGSVLLDSETGAPLRCSGPSSCPNGQSCCQTTLTCYVPGIEACPG